MIRRFRRGAHSRAPVVSGGQGVSLPLEHDLQLGAPFGWED